MPYIPKNDRPQYDTFVDELAEMLRSLGSNDDMVGPLSRIVHTLAIRRFWQGRRAPLCLYSKLNNDAPGYDVLAQDWLRYKALVKPLSDILGALENDAMVGPLNYIVSRLTWQLCGHGHGERRYARMNMVVGALDCVKSELKRAIASNIGFSKSAYVRASAAVGALDCAKSELQRRIIAPYEDEKIENSGDVEIQPRD